MNIPLSHLSIEQLKKAIAIREQIQALERELQQLFGAAEVPTPPAPVSPPESAPAEKKRTMSPEARARIGAAQRERWAKTKAAKQAAAPAVVSAPAEPKKRTMSPAARARIGAAQRARWAKVRAAKAAKAKAAKAKK